MTKKTTKKKTEKVNMEITEEAQTAVSLAECSTRGLPEGSAKSLADMSEEQKNQFADRLFEQLMAAEKSAKLNRTKDDIVKLELKDFETYTVPLSLYDESEYTVREYLVHDDVANQFAAFVDTAVRLDEFYKLDLMLASGDIEASEQDKISKEILYTPKNVQGIVSKHMKPTTEAEFTVVETVEGDK